MVPRSPTQTQSSSLKLKRFYRVLEIIGIAIPFLLSIAILLYKPYFIWLGNSLIEVAGSLFIVGCIYALLLGLSVVFRKRFFLEIARYCYLGFFVYFIAVTGGVESSFLITVILPIVLAAVYIDKVATRNIGITTTVVFALSIFVYPHTVIDGSVITKHLIHVAFVAVFSYLIYVVVVETLRQRGEAEEIEKRVDEILKVDRLKNDFLSIAQHQLRTPLSGVKWALEMLGGDKALPIETRALVESSLARVKDSLTIINQMLKTVETEAKGLVLATEQIDLVGMVRTIIAELNFVVVKKGTKVHFFCPESLLIPADRDKLKAALVNVIDNAIKYSPQGTVDITVVDDPKGAVLTVKDTGIGISPEDMPYLFVRMHRGKNAVLLEPDESGIGLYSSKKVIELHKGTISITSELNKGTTVVVVLPKNK